MVHTIATDDVLCDLTASDALFWIRSRRVTAEGYVAALLARADRLRHLNAFITIDHDAALAAAWRIDRMVSAGSPMPPLAGLAIAVKDNINLAGMPTSAGTPALRHACPKTTAPSLQKLLDAGAIVLGKTNMHELAFGITSTNLSSFAGPVRNPYDVSRIPGGSSGGTAAAISARIVSCGLGSDTGASTRLPAALTGTVGLRPSVGNGGRERRYHDANAVVPVSRTRDTVGPMGRTVADVALLDSVITATPRETPLPLRDVRLGVPPVFWRRLDYSLAEVAWSALDKLKAAGAALVDADLPDIPELNDQVSFQLALHEPLDDIPAYLRASGLDVTLADIVAQIASPDVRAAYDGVVKDVFGLAYEEAMQVHRPALQALYANYFREHKVDAIIFPTTILPAVPIDAVNGSGTVSINGSAPVDAFATYIQNTDPGSNAGIPGLSIPAGMTRDGLPVGIEIDGPLGSDPLLLRIGLSIEAVLGRLAPPNV